MPARMPNGGLVVLPDETNNTHRDLIVALTARHRLPAVYTNRFFVAVGGLMSYGIDAVDMFRQFGDPCRPHPARREACRPPGPGADQIRDGGQPQDGQGAWAYRAARPPGRRRRGDRIGRSLLRVLTAAPGRLCCKSILSISARNIDSRSGWNA